MLLVDIRYCSLKDLNDIYSIEMAAYEYPWPYEIFEADLKRKIGKIFYIGAWWGNKLCGFGTCRREKRKLKIMNLAVHPDFRRNKIGSQLLLAMGELGESLGCKRALLEVRVTNHPARLLYEQFGFKPIRLLLRYYQDGEDAYLMESPLPFQIVLPKDNAEPRSE